MVQRGDVIIKLGPRRFACEGYGFWLEGKGKGKKKSSGNFKYITHDYINFVNMIYDKCFHDSIDC